MKERGWRQNGTTTKTTNKQPLSNRTQNARHLQMQTLSCESKAVADKTGPAITKPNSRKRSLNGALRSGPDTVVLLSMMRQESAFLKRDEDEVFSEMWPCFGLLRVW